VLLAEEAKGGLLGRLDLGTGLLELCDGRGGQQLLGGKRLVDQSDLVVIMHQHTYFFVLQLYLDRIVSHHLRAQRQKLLSAAVPDDIDGSERDPLWHGEAQGDLVEADGSLAVEHEAVVAREGKDGAGAGCVPVDGGHRHQPRRVQAEVDLAQSEPVLCPHVGSVLEHLEVDAGREKALDAAGQHEPAHLLVALELVQRLEQPVDHGLVDGVGRRARHRHNAIVRLLVLGHVGQAQRLLDHLHDAAGGAERALGKGGQGEHLACDGRRDRKNKADFFAIGGTLMTYPDPVLASVMAVAATAALLYWWSAARSTAKRVAATAAARLADAALRRANQGQRILCLVNPFGGGGSAPAMFERTVRPVLEARGFEVERRDTQRAKHAWELAHELATTTASKYAAVCVVSGDGLVHEVVNGFMDDTGNKTGGNKTLVPILVIPIGSSNGIFATLNPSMRFESSEVQCRHAAYGDTVLKSDVFKVNVEPYESSSSSSSNNSTFGILSISYGIVAEGDHAVFLLMSLPNLTAHSQIGRDRVQTLRANPLKGICSDQGHRRKQHVLRSDLLRRRGAGRKGDLDRGRVLAHRGH